jgi:ABC-type branched-subunit amino acid transport system ATPase component
MTPALSTEKLSVRYGNVTALEDVDLAVEPGQLLGLIGPNGAGKTTFIDALTGFARATGSVRLGDLPLEGMAPHQRARHGLARTWQSSMLFEDLTVAENLSVCDEVVVLNFGRVIFRGPPDKVRSDPLVMSAYLGSGSTETQSGPKPVNEVQT